MATPEQRKIWAKNWYEKNKERRKELNQRYLETNPQAKEKRRLRNRKSAQLHRLAIAQRIRMKRALERQGLVMFKSMAQVLLNLSSK